MKWLITGAARGFGAAFTLAALEAGHDVCASVRDMEKLGELGPIAAQGKYKEHLHIVKIDVTKAHEVSAGVASAIDKFGRIDVLVNNAGFGMIGFFEEIAPSEWERQFCVNFFGALAVTRAVLPHMRDQKFGRIISMSSIAGLTGISGGSPYCASKFAMEGWMECLRPEVASFGIKCITVEPGYFRTDFLDPRSVTFAEGKIEAYKAARVEQQKFWKEIETRKNPGDPRKLARVLVELAESDDPPAHFLAGVDAVEMAEKQALEPRKADLAKWKQLSCSLQLEDEGEAREMKEQVK